MFNLGKAMSRAPIMSGMQKLPNAPMSIGVIALATLFPISVLRSIQASQLTNATNLRYNAEARIRTGKVRP